MDFIDYREKLGLGFTDKEKNKHFNTHIFNVLDMMIHEQWTSLTSKEYIAFCQKTGTKLEAHLCDMHRAHDRLKYCINVLDFHKQDTNDFLAYYLFFVNSLDNARGDDWERKHFVKVLENALCSAHIAYEILKDGEDYFIFPKGAKELDDALVSEVLEWLNEYPETKTEWVQALSDYSSATEENASDVADKFRKALERFLQEFFEQNKSIENLRSEYGTFMKDKGVPKELSNNLETLLQAYANFMNGYAKHQNKTSKNTLEYIMYQTGNIIRFLITLNK